MELQQSSHEPRVGAGRAVTRGIAFASAVAAFAMLATGGGAAGAQAAPQRRTVEGRVTRPEPGARRDSSGMSAAAGVWVTLHRVATDAAGPLDSTRADGDGRYALSWTPRGGDAVYFASVTYGGIAYFTPPLREARNIGDIANIAVFDTTSREFPLSVRGRHLIVGALDSTDSRTVIEVFELSNDSTRTLVSAEGDNPTATWNVRVPDAARDLRANEGEVSPDAFAFSNGRVSVFAPIAPGVKQLSFSYRLPSGSFPLAFTADAGATVFEVLLEEPQGTVTAPGMTAVQAVTLEGRNFRRFLGQDIPANTRFVVDVPSGGRGSRGLYIAGLLVGIGFLMMLGLTRAMGRRVAPAPLRPRGVAGLDAPSAVPLADRLAAEIAALDATFARQTAPSDSVRAAYDARRAELKAALAGELVEMPRT